MIAKRKSSLRTRQNQSSELYEALLAARMPGEQILWWARPGVWRFCRISAGMFVMTLCITFFVLVYLLALNALFSWLFVLFVLAWPAYAAGGTLLGAIEEFQKAKRTVYGITRKRVLIITLNQNSKVKIEQYIPVAESFLTTIALYEGHGDLAYAKRRTINERNSPPFDSFSILGIPNVREVELLIRETFLSEDHEHLRNR